MDQPTYGREHKHIALMDLKRKHPAYLDVVSYTYVCPLQDNFKKIHNGKYYVEWDCGADLSSDTIEAKWTKFKT